MPSSKEDARLEAYKKLRDEALASERTSRTQAEAAVARAKAAEEKLLEAAMNLDVAREKLAGAESKAASLVSEADGAKADLLATTRRLVLSEALFQCSEARVESLRSVLEQIATWPTTHSGEAKAMRQIAVAGLHTDQMRRRAASEPQAPPVSK